MIEYLKRDEIDDAKWDGCIRQAVNSLPYGYTWYLDSAAGNWDGLVLGDYEMVFPLVWGRRLAIHYLFQPFFTQQLGAFTTRLFNVGELNAILKAIPARFKFIEINLNYLNEVAGAQFEIEKRINLCLDLSGSYDDLFNAYHDNAKRNVNKAEKKNLNVREIDKPEIIIEFFKTNTGIKIPELGEFHYEHLEKIINEAVKRNAGIMFGVFDEQQNLLAAGFFLITENRIINILPSIDEGGKELGAGFCLVNDVIKRNAGSGKTFDFEGSMIPAIARFYNSFGAYEQPYWRIKRNNLPWYFKWIKG